MRVACVLVTRLRAKVELDRQPHLKERPVLIVDRSRGRPAVVDRFPSASGVAVGMTLEQALSRRAESVVLEADEAAYRRAFQQILDSLQEVSDRVEGAELGTAYAMLDGLEAMHGGEPRLVKALLDAVPQELAPRVGVGDAKFPAYVAARSSGPLGMTWVPPDAAGFLASHPVDLLPVPGAVRRELRRFGLHTLGDVAALPPEALAVRFGAAGRRAWELSQGIDGATLIPRQLEESVVEHTSLPFASASLELLLTAVDLLLQRAYAQPRMRGRYAGGAVLECVLFRNSPWAKDFHFKQPVGDWQRASRILRGRLEADHPQAPVEELRLTLSNLTGESGLQLSLLSDLRGDRERRLEKAEGQLQARMGGKPALYRVVEVAPWHPAPELRAMQVPLGTAGTEGMKPLSRPSPVLVREGPEGEPTAVRLGNRWLRVSRIEDLWCFDLWWMPQPMARTYYRVGREDGGEATLFRDLRENRWFRQDP